MVLFLRGGGDSTTNDNVLPAVTDTDSCSKDKNCNGNEANSGERGLVCFGQNTNQTFVACKFTKDPSIEIQPFVIELRLLKDVGLED